MKNKEYSFSVATTLVISYLVITLVPIIVAFAIHFGYDKALTERTQLSNEYVTETIAARIETIMKDVRNFYSNIASNKNFHAISYITDRNDYFNSKEYFLFVNDFNSYKVNKNILFSYIYFEDTDSIFSEYGTYESKVFYDTFIHNATYDEWKNTLTRKNKGIHFSQTIRVKGENHDTALFNFSVPSFENITVAILVDHNSFFQETNKTDIETLCNIYLFDNHGKLVLYNVSQKSDKLPKNINEIHTKNNIIFKTPISFDTVKMTLVASAPLSQVMAHIKSMRLLTFILVIFCIIFAGILSTYFTLRHYKPVKKILSLLGISDRKDEYSQIHRSINQMTSDINKQNNALRLSVLSRIIKRSYVGGYAGDLLQKYGINFKNENFVVAGFCVDNIDKLFKNEPDLSSGSKYDNLNFIITNVFEELLNTEDSVSYVLDIDNMLCCVMNISTSVQNPYEFISEKYNYGISTINSHFGLNLTYVLSDIHCGISGLPEAYSEVLQTLEYKNMLDILSPLSYRDIKKEIKIEYEFTLEKEQKLINCIRALDVDGAIQIVDDVLKKAKEDKNISLEHLKCLMLDIATSVLKIPNTSQRLEFNPNKILNYSNNINSMRESIISAINEICKSTVPNSNLQQFQNKILGYIQSNYNSPSLNVDSIGYYFDMTPDYISKMFKEINGESLVDYINKYRLSKAKELIISKKYTMSDISSMVGYNHVRTFNRVFKKYEGITPTMFKKELE